MTLFFLLKSDTLTWSWDSSKWRMKSIRFTMQRSLYIMEHRSWSSGMAWVICCCIRSYPGTGYLKSFPKIIKEPISKKWKYFLRDVVNKSFTFDRSNVFKKKGTNYFPLPRSVDSCSDNHNGVTWSLCSFCMHGSQIYKAFDRSSTAPQEWHTTAERLSHQ